jgi:hypothetical protein
MMLRSPTEDENPDLRHAGTDCRHPGAQGCLRRHPCQPDSSTPCWNETIEECTKTNRGTPPFLFSKGHTKITKFGTKLVLQKTILTLLRIGHSRKLLSARRDFVQSPPAVTTIAPILQHSVFLTLVPRGRDPGFPAPGDRLQRT